MGRVQGLVAEVAELSVERSSLTEHVLNDLLEDVFEVRRAGGHEVLTIRDENIFRLERQLPDVGELDERSVEDELRRLSLDLDGNERGNLGHDDAFRWVGKLKSSRSFNRN